MAADMLVDGMVKASFVPTVADLAAPTVAELTAGTSLEPRLTPDGLGITFDDSMIDNSSLNSSYSTEAIGRSKVAITLKYKAQEVGSTDAVKTALSYLSEGFLVVRRGVLASTAFTTGDKVEVYPAQCGRPNPSSPAPNTIQTVTVKLGSTGAPKGFGDEAVVAA